MKMFDMSGHVDPGPCTVRDSIMTKKKKKRKQKKEKLKELGHVPVPSF